MVGVEIQKSLSAPADCTRCGACCFSELETYVRVTGEDWNRLGERAEKCAHFIGNRAYLRMKAGRCAALEFRTDAAGEGHFLCRIYDQRPQVCRDLGRGSPECSGERATKTARVAAAVGMVASSAAL